jgi:hypothetical protein
VRSFGAHVASGSRLLLLIIGQSHSIPRASWRIEGGSFADPPCRKAL